ncbi:MAG: transglutaminase-like domain-containing protein, partial [Pirellulales bacterium]|nr:transglutaminase-like domain-containing protein [Pirellulales bacterium]
MMAYSKWWLGGLLVTLAMLVSSTFRTWSITCSLAAMACLVVAARGKTPTRAGERNGPAAPTNSPRWLKWIVVSAAIGIILGGTFTWRLTEHLGESINLILAAIDILAHATIICALLVWAMQSGRGHVSMLVSGLLVILLCVAAGGTSQSLTTQTTVALGACLGFVIASQIILASIRDTTHQAVFSRTSVDRRSRLTTTLFSLLTLSLILMATSAMAKLTDEALPTVQANIRSQLKQSLEVVGDARYLGGTRYVRGNILGSIRKHILTDPREVAIRVYTDREPGYLRGTVFDIYRRQRWFAASNSNLPPEYQSSALNDRLVVSSGRGTAYVEQKGSRTLTRFQLEPAIQEKTFPLEIRGEPSKGTLVFLPLTTKWLEANSSELVLSHHDIVRLGVDITHSYVAGVAAEPAPEPLDGTRRKLMLDIPDRSADILRQTAQQVCPPDADARAKARAVENFFQRQFTYSLEGTLAPDGVDPLEYFLQQRHPAHCEYFAAAAALVLRAADVPTRYVTGYVSTEYSDETYCWLARNKDAHAWVEAYDDKTQQWFPVEATPGRSYSTVNPFQNSQSSSSAGGSRRETWEEEGENVFQRLWGWL